MYRMEILGEKIKSVKTFENYIFKRKYTEVVQNMERKTFDREREQRLTERVVASAVVGVEDYDGCWKTSHLMLHAGLTTLLHTLDGQ